MGVQEVYKIARATMQINEFWAPSLFVQNKKEILGDIGFDLEDYYNEVAKEFVSSGSISSKYGDLGSRRLLRGYYRSDLLDKILSKNLGLDPKFGMHYLPSVSTHLNDFAESLELSQALNNKVWNSFKNSSSCEIIKKELEPMEYWSDEGLISVIEKEALRWGLIYRAQNIHAYSGLQHVVEKNLDGENSIYGVLMSFCPDSESKDFYFRFSWYYGPSIGAPTRSLGDLSIILPGIQYYFSRLEDLREARLGISALFCLACSASDWGLDDLRTKEVF